MNSDQIQLIKEFHRRFRLSYVTFNIEIGSTPGQTSPAFIPRETPLEAVELAENENGHLQASDGTLIITDREVWFETSGQVVMDDFVDVKGRFILKTQ